MNDKRKLRERRKIKQFQEIIDWVHARLDEIFEAEITNRPPSGMDYGAWLSNLGPEIDALQRGDKAPLLKKHPALAAFIVEPSKRKRIKDPTINKVWFAVWAMKHIPKFWKGTDFKKDASQVYKLTAIELAARWAKIDHNDEKIMKKLDSSLKRRIRKH